MVKWLVTPVIWPSNTREYVFFYTRGFNHSKVVIIFKPGIMWCHLHDVKEKHSFYIIEPILLLHITSQVSALFSHVTSQFIASTYYKSSHCIIFKSQCIIFTCLPHITSQVSALFSYVTSQCIIFTCLTSQCIILTCHESVHYFHMSRVRVSALF